MPYLSRKSVINYFFCLYPFIFRMRLMPRKRKLKRKYQNLNLIKNCRYQYQNRVALIFDYMDLYLATVTLFLSFIYKKLNKLTLKFVDSQVHFIISMMTKTEICSLQNCRKSISEECIFYYIALRIECQFKEAPPPELPLACWQAGKIKKKS